MKREKSGKQDDSCRELQLRSGTWEDAFCTSLVGDLNTWKSGNQGTDKVTPGLKRSSYRQKDMDFIFLCIMEMESFFTLLGHHSWTCVAENILTC